MGDGAGAPTARRFGIGWRQVFLCLIILTAGGTAVPTVFSVLAVPLGREFHPTRMVLMLAITLIGVGSGVLSPVLGSVLDRVSVKRMMALGATLVVTGYFLLSFVTAYWQVLVIYGLFFAPSTLLAGALASIVLISRWFVRRRGTALGLAVLGIALGGFLFPPVVGWLVEHFSWREGLRIYAVILTAILFPAIAMIVNSPAERGLYPDGDANPPPAEPHAPMSSARMFFTDPAFLLGALVFAVILSGLNGVMANLVPMAVDSGIRPERAALLMSIYSGSGLISKGAFAAFSDRLTVRVIMTISLSGFATGMVLLMQAGGVYGLIALGVGVVGMFGGIMVPLQGLFIARVYGSAVVGRGVGLLNVLVLVAMLVTPPAFGRIRDVTGSYQSVFLIFACIAAATLLIVPRIRAGARASAVA